MDRRGTDITNLTICLFHKRRLLKEQFIASMFFSDLLFQ